MREQDDDRNAKKYRVEMVMKNLGAPDSARETQHINCNHEKEKKMISKSKNVEFFRKIVQQVMGFKKLDNAMTVKSRKYLCTAVIYKMVQEKVGGNNHHNHKNQYFFHKTDFLFFILFLVFFMTPPPAGAGESRQMANPVKIVPNTVLCRTGRLTDIVVPEKILKVVMSNPSDFKFVTIRYKSRTHLVIKPLKEAAESDLIIFGINNVHYLLAKSVSSRHRYEIRVDIGAQKLDSPR